MKILTIYIPILLSIALLLGYFFLYNVYGNEVRKSPSTLFADPESTMKIEIVPINALGSRAIFRKSSAKFDFEEGKDLIEIILVNHEEGILIIRSTGKQGKVGIKIKSKHSLFPEYIEIEILTRTA